ncbi:hypothetical protein MTR67_001315 [Solanum verrucosum]|uniref:Uncharacterized protein n=1 Tax=Solanum verrucosum TaxID=315347 RepID=A0AAF0TCB0_SOLVR|nr:hypothetical protein MTR67_001315 [Solanum verrucosum]
MRWLELLKDYDMSIFYHPVLPVISYSTIDFFVQLSSSSGSERLGQPKLGGYGTPPAGSTDAWMNRAGIPGMTR